MNSKMILFWVLMSLIGLNIQAQGMIFDQQAFENGDQFEGERSAYIPDAFSLKKYAPYVFMQQLSTCVAYSTASALTIAHAINNNETDTKKISLGVFSPHWIYFRNKDKSDTGCEEGLNIDRTMLDVLNYGVPYMLLVEYPDYYPFGEIQLCNYYPPDFEKDAAMAVINRPDEIVRVKYTDDIKLAISSGLPVVVGMNVPPSFENAIGTSLWTPKITETKLEGYGHAMVVVGYDDNKYGGAFEILNSWSEAWGDEGYIWVKYSDFQKFFWGGYAIYKEKKLRAEPPKLLQQGDSNPLESDIKLSNSGKIKKVKGKNKWRKMTSFNGK